MKKTKAILLTATISAILFGATIFSACTKSSPADPCSGVTCLNGGTCAGGICSCPTGYSGTYCGTAATTSLQFNNDTYTPIVMTVNGVNSTIAVGGSVTYTGAFGSTMYYTAYTYGQTTSGEQVGEEVTWNSSATFPNSGTYTIGMDVSSTMFFLKVQDNDPNYAVDNGIYVNYGLTAQTFDNVSLLNDGVIYNIGYYNAYTNTEIYIPYGGTSNWYLYPSFSFVNNQYELMILP